MTLKGGHVRSELSVFLPHDSFRKIAPDPHESDLLEWYSKEHLRRFRLEDLQEKINRFLEENKEFPFRDIAVFRDVPRDAPFVRLDLVIPPNLRENKNRASLESHLAVLSKYLKGLTLSKPALPESEQADELPGGLADEEFLYVDGTDVRRRSKSHKKGRYPRKAAKGKSYKF